MRRMMVGLVAAVVVMVAGMAKADETLKTLSIDEKGGGLEATYDSIVISYSDLATATGVLVEKVVASEEAVKTKVVPDTVHRTIGFQMGRVKLTKLSFVKELGPAKQYDLDFTRRPSDVQLGKVLSALKDFAEVQFGGKALVGVLKAPQYSDAKYEILVLMTGGQWDYFKPAKDAPAAPAKP